MLDYQGNGHKAQKDSSTVATQQRLNSRVLGGKHGTMEAILQVRQPGVKAAGPHPPPCTYTALSSKGGKGVPVHPILVGGGGWGRAKKTITQDKLQNKGEGATQVKWNK